MRVMLKTVRGICVVLVRIGAKQVLIKDVRRSNRRYCNTRQQSRGSAQSCIGQCIQLTSEKQSDVGLHHLRKCALGNTVQELFTAVHTEREHVARSYVRLGNPPGCKHAEQSEWQREAR